MSEDFDAVEKRLEEYVSHPEWCNDLGQLPILLTDLRLLLDEVERLQKHCEQSDNARYRLHGELEKAESELAAERERADDAIEWIGCVRDELVNAGLMEPGDRTMALAAIRRMIEALRLAVPESRPKSCTCGDSWPCPLHGGPPAAPEPTPSEEPLVRFDKERAERLEKALRSIAANTCCGTCREAALVAREALRPAAPHSCQPGNYPDCCEPAAPDPTPSEWACERCGYYNRGSICTKFGAVVDPEKQGSPVSECDICGSTAHVIHPPSHDEWRGWEAKGKP